MDMYQKRKMRQENKNNQQNKESNKTNINWYPGHMAKAKRLISEKLPMIDVVIEVLDARMPYSSKIKDIDNLVKGKPRILVLTKYDLCDKKETNKWIKHYEEKGYFVLSTDLTKQTHFKEELLNTMKLATKEFTEKRKEKGMSERRIRTLIVGIPNVGKSTLINHLVGKKAVNVGNKPGVTKTLDWIRIHDEVELLDTPGILWPKLEEKSVAYNLATFSAIKEEVLPMDSVSVYILDMLSKYYPSILEERYGVTDFDMEDVEPTFIQIGKKRGCLIKGGEVDYDRVVTLIINDIKNGIIKGITFDRWN